MLNISIRNFRGIKAADLQASPIALLCGRNEQGKSSVIDGIRAVLDGTAQPYKLTKDELAGHLLYRGTEAAKVLLTGDGRGMRTDWPSGEVSTEGAPFRATPYATGSKKYTALTPRERSQALAQYLKTDPTSDETQAALIEIGAEAAEYSAIWKETQTLGWDGAWQKHKTDATKLKGAWEQITGASYGVKVGGNWRPKNWGAEHEAMTDSEMQELLDEDTKAYEDAVGKVAITGEEKARLEALTKQIPKLEELLSTREADGKRAKGVLDKAEAALQQIPVLEPNDWPKCPHCGEPVAVRAKKGGGSALEKPKKALDDKERKKIEDQAEDAERVVAEARKVYEEMQGSWQTCKNDLTKAKDAKAQLETADPAAAGVDLAGLRANLDGTKALIAAKQKIRDAVKKHAEVILRLDIAQVLAPEGLRNKKLQEKLDDFNERLAALCITADWSPVTITTDGEVELNGVRYALCSGSGRYRCDATLQVAMADLDGSEVILCDEADVLDAKGRNGLLTMLAATEKYCIVAMMLTKIVQAPDLAAAEMGTSYWIDNATSTTLEEYKAKAA